MYCDIIFKSWIRQVLMCDMKVIGDTHVCKRFMWKWFYKNVLIHSTYTDHRILTLWIYKFQRPHCDLTGHASCVNTCKMISTQHVCILLCYIGNYGSYLCMVLPIKHMRKCARIHTHMHIHAYTHTHTHMHTPHTHTHAQSHTHTHARARTHIHTHSCTHAHTHACAYTHTHTIQTLTHAYTRLHTLHTLDYTHCIH